MDRIGSGIKSGIFMGSVYSIIALILTYFFSNQIALLFVDQAETAIMADIRMFLIGNGLFYIPLTI